MKRPLIIIVALVAALGAGLVATAGLAAWSIKADAEWTGEAESLDALIAHWAEQPAIPGVIAHIQRGDEVLYAGAAGTTRMNGGEPLTPDTPFHTASVGKLFTAAVVLRLHEQGRLDIDAPAARYVDEQTLRGLVVVDGVDYWDQFTVRELLQHRAGLPDIDRDLYTLFVELLGQPWRRRTAAEVVAWSRRPPAAGRPGEQTLYSSTGYILLGLVVEGATGRPYHVVAREEIFDRLGMAATYHKHQELDLPIAAREPLHPYVGWFDLALYDPTYEFADGGYVTTAPDLARFAMAIAHDTLFDQPDTMALYLSAPQGEHDPSGYQGLGPYVSRTEGGALLVLHTGFWCVYLGVYPEHETAFVFTMGQFTAQLWTFWDQARAIAEPAGLLPR